MATRESFEMYIFNSFLFKLIQLNNNISWGSYLAPRKSKGFNARYVNLQDQ